MKESYNRIKPSAHKKVLIFIAGSIWLGVGIMLNSLATTWLYAYSGSITLFVVSGIVLALIIHKFGFSKIATKNISRIDELPPKPCLFSFISFKSYLIVLVMISLGISLRHSDIPKHYLAIMYIGIGTALFLSSLIYFVVLFKKRKT